MTQTAVSNLAVNGGRAVRRDKQPWPKWPRAAPDAESALLEVLVSGRWAITSPQGKTELWERRFAKRFADYTDSRYCVPVDHGSSALVVALEALELEYGDRVLVPALTWTACAGAVFRAGLVPVLVDVSRETGCITPDSLDLASAPRAVMAVHWGSSMADIPAIANALKGSGIAIIEDCAQAHGALWQGKPAGSFGDLGCFSMQNGKVLSAGEGGAVVTSSDVMAHKLQELRADSRSYGGPADPLRLELVESASVMGANYCMSEFGAALLWHQLDSLDQEHESRNLNYALLDRLLADVGGVSLVKGPPEQTRWSIYEATVVFEDEIDNREIAAQITAELGLLVYPVDNPLHRSNLMKPWTRPSYARLTADFVSLSMNRRYPNSEYLARHGVQFHHSALLGSADDMYDIAEAVAKVLAATTR